MRDLLEKAVGMPSQQRARTADYCRAGREELSTVEMGDAVLSALDKVAGKEREHA